MILNNLFNLSFILLISACSTGHTNELSKEKDTVVSESHEPNLNEANIDKDKVSKIDTSIVINEKATSYNGIVRYKARWTDKNGQNILIISGRKDNNDKNDRAEIFAYHYIFKKKTVDFKLEN